jgi:hypothetical protein
MDKLWQSIIVMIEKQIKNLFKSKAEFCRQTGKSDNERKNLDKTISSIYKKVEDLRLWLKPLDIEIHMVLKKPKSEEEKINCGHTSGVD